jgi:hypothetical protein
MAVFPKPKLLSVSDADFRFGLLKAESGLLGEGNPQSANCLRHSASASDFGFRFRFGIQFFISPPSPHQKSPFSLTQLLARFKLF